MHLYEFLFSFSLSLSLSPPTPTSIPAGAPGSVDLLNVEASSSSSLDVSWLCPEAIGTYDAVLLTYRVSYTEDSSTASPMTVDVRALVGMVTPDSCLVKTTVSSLKEGTTYSVTVRAMAGGNMGQRGVISADASTFGQGKGVGTICGVSSFSLFSWRL